nr:glycosyltransferase family 4 protein [Haloferax sp. BAB-2207]
MKIAHVYDEHYRVSPEKGSVAKVIYNLAKTQAQLGHDVTVLERQWKDLPKQERQGTIQFVRFPLPIGSDIEGEEVPYKQIKSPTGLLTLLFDRLDLALKLRKHFKETDYDVIHFHVPFAANILIHICPKIRKKIVYTAHVGEEDTRFGLAKNNFVSRILSLFSPDLHLMKRITASSVLNERLKEKIPPSDVRVIPNGVDVSEYNPENTELVDLKSEFNIQTPFVLFVGTITPRKGPDILLDAIRSLEQADNIDDFSFVFAGNQEIDIEFATNLIERSTELDTEIHFPGFVSLQELKALFASADVFVLPSHEEGWGMVITEAMASETPIVATDVSGIPHQVNHEENGYLIERGDSSQLSDSIRILIEDRQLRRQMGEESRRIAVEQFSWNSVATQYMSMYNSTVPGLNDKC